MTNKEKYNPDYKQGFIDGMKKAVELFATHEEGFGDYCDTNSNMDWDCRSKCTEHGVMRCRKYYKEYILPNLTK